MIYILGEDPDPKQDPDPKHDPDPKFLIFMITIRNTGFKSVSDLDLHSVRSGQVKAGHKIVNSLTETVNS